MQDLEIRAGGANGKQRAIVGRAAVVGRAIERRTNRGQAGVRKGAVAGCFGERVQDLETRARGTDREDGPVIGRAAVVARAIERRTNRRKPE